MCCFSLLIATSNRYLQTGLFFIRTFSNVAIPMLEKPLQTMFSWYFFRAGIACLIYDSFFSAILWEWCIFGSWSYTSKCKMISSSFKDYQVMKFCIIPNWKCHEPFPQRKIIIIRSFDIQSIQNSTEVMKCDHRYVKNELGKRNMNWACICFWNYQNLIFWWLFNVVEQLLLSKMSL